MTSQREQMTKRIAELEAALERHLAAVEADERNYAAMGRMAGAEHELRLLRRYLHKASN